MCSCAGSHGACDNRFGRMNRGLERMHSLFLACDVAEGALAYIETCISFEPSKRGTPTSQTSFSNPIITPSQVVCKTAAFFSLILLRPTGSVKYSYYST